LRAYNKAKFHCGRGSTRTPLGELSYSTTEGSLVRKGRKEKRRERIGEGRREVIKGKETRGSKGRERENWNRAAD